MSHGGLATAGEYGDHRADFDQALAAHDGFRATTTLPPDVSKAEIRDLGAPGFIGIRLHWRPLDASPDPESNEQQRLFRLCAEIGWHVHVIDRPERLDRTIRAVERADAPIVADHMGFIDTESGANAPAFQALLKALDRRRCWVTLSGGSRFKHCDPDDLARALVAAGGNG